MERLTRSIPPRKDKTMTVQELISRLFDRVQSGELKGSDPVPADLLEDNVLEHKSVAEYMAEKYGIGEDGNERDLEH